ncbi:hypothetical protein HDU98_008550 [Podochytrium sp. JEL0797]|nr:hypothetical protein HDU98_008550 [Podochytrium sp. JEL0797]
MDLQPSDEPPPANNPAMNLARQILTKNVKPITAKHQKGWLSVSDFSSLMWCEHKAFYAATSSRKVPTTAAMARGVSIHHDIEREIMPEQKIIQTASNEDWWAVKLLEMIVAVNVLLDSGTAREIPVLGRIGPFLMYGVIDQVHRRCEIPPNAAPNWSYILSDTKTRAANSLPRKASTLNTKLQTSIYSFLFNQLTGNLDPVETERQPPLTDSFFFSSIPHLNPSRTLSPQVITYAHELLCENGGTSLSSSLMELSEPPTTLSTLFPIVMQWFKIIPKLSPQMEVEYRWQKDPSVKIGTVIEEYDAEFVHTQMERGVQFWQGSLKECELLGVEDVEEVGFRCNNCVYNLDCDWLAGQRKKHDDMMNSYTQGQL